MTKSELDYLVSAAQRFYNEAGFDFPLNAKEYYQELDKNPFIFSIIEEGKGFIICSIAPSFLTPSLMQCSEIAWYVEKEYRGGSTAIKLMKKYEQLAVSKNCDLITMVALEQLDPIRTGNIYKKLGYKSLEHHYIKEI